MKADGCKVQLSSGRTFKAHCGLLNPHTSGSLFDGYDSTQSFAGEPLTAAERREIADAMKASWEEWARTGEPLDPYEWVSPIEEPS